MSGPFRYDICLSFAGEDRRYVQAVAALLRSAGVRVFYDEYEQVELWGKNLYTHLDEVYQKASRFCVIFISQYYAKKVWTNHERESAQARAFTESSDYILPARFDDTEIPGIRPTVGWIDLRKLTPEGFSNLILAKIRSDATVASDEEVHHAGGPEDPAQSFAERLSFWREQGIRFWSVVAYVPRLRSITWDPCSQEVADAVHSLQLPLYLAAPLTSRPNAYRTRPASGGRLIHEDFRMLDEGVGFRIEIRPDGMVEVAICFDELLQRYTSQNLADLGIRRILPRGNDLSHVRALIPWPPFAKYLSEQLGMMHALIGAADRSFSDLECCSALCNTKHLSLLVPRQWSEALLGYPVDDDLLRFSCSVGTDEPFRVSEAMLQSFVRDFGMQLDKLMSAEGKILDPRLFSRGPS